jgi:hypothetical protein
VKIEGGETEGKGVKRDREEDEDDGVIEISSDDDDLGTLQVMCTACHGSQIPDMV